MDYWTKMYYFAQIHKFQEQIFGDNKKANYLLSTIFLLVITTFISIYIFFLPAAIGRKQFTCSSSFLLLKWAVLLSFYWCCMETNVAENCNEIVGICVHYHRSVWQYCCNCPLRAILEYDSLEFFTNAIYVIENTDFCK